MDYHSYGGCELLLAEIPHWVNNVNLNERFLKVSSTHELVIKRAGEFYFGFIWEGGSYEVCKCRPGGWWGSTTLNFDRWVIVKRGMNILLVREGWIDAFIQVNMKGGDCWSSSEKLSVTLGTIARKMKGFYT